MCTEGALERCPVETPTRERRSVDSQISTFEILLGGFCYPPALMDRHIVVRSELGGFAVRECRLPDAYVDKRLKVQTKKGNQNAPLSGADIAWVAWHLYPRQ